MAVLKNMSLRCFKIDLIFMIPLSSTFRAGDELGMPTREYESMLRGV